MVAEGQRGTKEMVATSQRLWGSRHQGCTNLYFSCTTWGTHTVKTMFEIHVKPVCFHCSCPRTERVKAWSMISLIGLTLVTPLYLCRALTHHRVLYLKCTYRTFLFPFTVVSPQVGVSKVHNIQWNGSFEHSWQSDTLATWPLFRVHRHEGTGTSHDRERRRPCSSLPGCSHRKRA